MKGFDGHHINGIGYDCRIENLMPLERHEHRKRHRRWVEDHQDPRSTRGGEESGRWQHRRSIWSRVRALHVKLREKKVGHTNIGAILDDSREPFLLPAARRDRGQHLNMLLKCLLEAGGELMISNLMDSLSMSRSSVIELARAAERRGAVELTRRGRSLVVRLMV
ncbi:hypothetical protein D3C87_1499290 [compost metagenome]